MLKHYIKLAIRSINSNRLLFGGSLFTLVFGTICISVLYTYIQNENSMDGFHKNKNNIYMMLIRSSPESEYEVVETGIDKKDYPEIKELVDLKKLGKDESKISFGVKTLSPDILVVSDAFFKVFDFKLGIGDEKTILDDPNAVLITKSFSNKLFGSIDPINQSVKVNASGDERIYTVKGILNDPPTNSSITFDVIVPLSEGCVGQMRMGSEFILTNEPFDKVAFLKKVRFISRLSYQAPESNISISTLQEVYNSKGSLNRFRGVISHLGDKKNQNTLTIILIVLFLISVINFSNLLVIRINSNLNKRIITRINGATINNNIIQEIIEMVIMFLLSTIIAAIISILLLPYINDLTQIQLKPTIWQVLQVDGIILILLISLSMIYPLFTSYRKNTLSDIKNIESFESRLLGRNSALIFQFTLTIALIISSTIVYKQLDLMLHKDLGFETENIIKVQLFRELPRMNDEQKMIDNYKKQQSDLSFVKNELNSSPWVASFTQGDTPFETYMISWKLKDSNNKYVAQNLITTDCNYNSVLKFKVLEGRFFEEGKDESRQHKLVINEAAKAYWGIKDINKERLLNESWDRENGFEIIGVVKDFNYEHLSSKPKPLMIFIMNDIEDNFLIKSEKGNLPQCLNFVRSLYTKINPNQPFEYTMLSDEASALYQKEKSLSRLYIIFTAIAIMILIIGLFTIALYDTQRRTKEIGIRKVNGGTVMEIIILLNKDIVKSVAIAFVIACPIAWFVMDKWLENFAYKTELSWLIFIFSGFLALTIAFLTVSWQSYKAANKNPVESLKDE